MPNGERKRLFPIMGGGVFPAGITIVSGALGCTDGVIVGDVVIVCGAVMVGCAVATIGGVTGAATGGGTTTGAS